jgi:phosphatidate cytidylyltransferase
VVTAVVMATVLISAVLLLDTPWVALLIGLVVSAGALEWARLSGLDTPLVQILYALALIAAGGALYLVEPRELPARVVAVVAALWWVMVGLRLITHHRPEGFFASPGVRLMAGLLTLLPPWYLLVFMHSRPDQGPLLMLYTMALVWIADTGAYFAGRRLGRRKLASHISPGKTIEGLAGGLAATALWGVIGAIWLGLSFAQGLLLVGVVVLTGIISVAGDLLESVLKRVAGVKDSGHLLPGHGGVLDRIDSATAAVPVAVLGLGLLGVLG